MLCYTIQHGICLKKTRVRAQQLFLSKKDYFHRSGGRVCIGMKRLLNPSPTQCFLHGGFKLIGNSPMGQTAGVVDLNTKWGGGGRRQGIKPHLLLLLLHFVSSPTLLFLYKYRPIGYCCTNIHATSNLTLISLQMDCSFLSPSMICVSV